MTEDLSDWWDGVELWLAQLWFPLQFALVMAVLIPLCLGAAWAIDRTVDYAAHLRRRTRGERDRSRRST